jgi:type II secretory pathway pseudopilin PulG
MRLAAAERKVVGFSLVELIMALLVAIVLIAIGLPIFLRAYRIYELNNAARQVADILRLARYEAIRLNTPVNCMIQATGSTPLTTNMWVDSFLVGGVPNGVPDPTEKIIILGTSGNLVNPPGTPPPIAGDIGSLTTYPPSPTADSVQFDARGAAKPPTRVNVFYLSSDLAPEAGYRAVVLMPAGTIQIWTADPSLNWQQLR